MIFYAGSWNTIRMSRGIFRKMCIKGWLLPPLNIRCGAFLPSPSFGVKPRFIILILKTTRMELWSRWGWMNCPIICWLTWKAGRMVLMQPGRWTGNWCWIIPILTGKDASLNTRCWKANWIYGPAIIRRLWIISWILSGWIRIPVTTSPIFGVDIGWIFLWKTRWTWKKR